jgi:glycosyltransferase involved in cell wall biosynthesis
MERRWKILVACHDVVLSGGLLRFDRVAAVLRGWGHELSFVAFAPAPTLHRPTDVPVLSFHQAAARTWDAVMVPGAGFPEETIAQFAALRASNFGVRVQHVLNDQTRRAGFAAVNKAFAPHVLVFNNTHWPPGSFTEFQADRFHVLLGAVDTRAFRPLSSRSHPIDAGHWVVGGLANKNPDVLVETLGAMPDDSRLKLFGHDSTGLAGRFRDLVSKGRLELTGPLYGEDLIRFYGQVDCVAMTETFAGWSNLVAEAMASGVPVVCTPHGTTALARHNETALVLDAPTPGALAASLQRLRGDAALCADLAANARKTVERFDWESYSRELLRLAEHDGARHYVHAPELDLHGKWPLQDRLLGLEPLLAQARRLRVADFGAAEGVVGREFLKRGAAALHGFELDAARVKFANTLCSGWSGALFRQADFSDWDRFASDNADMLRESYDVVLYLGIHHHLPPERRRDALTGAVRLARRYFAFRAPAAAYKADAVDELLRSEGFSPLRENGAAARGPHLGPARIYARREAKP